MSHRLLISACLAVLTAAPVPAGALESVRALRTLDFEVDVHVSERRETPGEGIGPTRPSVAVKGGRAVGGQSGGAVGNGAGTVTAAISAKGSIRVAVIGATDDAGLIVEVSETALQRTRPNVRIAVATDGMMSYDPKDTKNLTEEEVAVVRWLARGFYGDRPTEPGTSWTVDQSGYGRTDIERYRVVANDARRVTLDYALEEQVSGTTGYNALREGSLLYDIAMIVPVKATFQSQARRQIGLAYDTTRTSVTVTLTADSFARAAKP
jgi:hypothetical protein